MTASVKRFRAGSAAVVFAILSVVWFFFAWITIGAMGRGVPDATDWTALKYAVVFTVPLLVVVAIAAVVRNTTGSEGTSWLAALATLVVAVLVGFSLVSRIALSFS